MRRALLAVIVASLILFASVRIALNARTGAPMSRPHLLSPNVSVTRVPMLTVDPDTGVEAPVLRGSRALTRRHIETDWNARNQHPSNRRHRRYAVSKVVRAERQNETESQAVANRTANRERLAVLRAMGSRLPGQNEAEHARFMARRTS